MSEAKKIRVVIIQNSITHDLEYNLKNLIKKINSIKVGNKKTIIVNHELSYLRYFPITKNTIYKKYAITISSKIIKTISSLCLKKNIYFLFSFYEKSRNKFYNSSILISPKGLILGKYRKKNIPYEDCYHEKYYFNESKNQHAVINIGVCKIGLMTCWDQWHADSYRQLSELGVDLILCPTSIGYAFKNNKIISITNEKEKWINVVTANSLMINTPIVVANRIGTENYGSNVIKFWGSSFVTNANGDIVLKMSNKESISSVLVNLGMKKKCKRLWGFNEKN